MTTPRQGLRRLRALLGLNQVQMGQLLGLGERSVLRVESGAEVSNDASARLVWLLLRTRLVDLEGVLRHLLLEALPPAELADLAERRELLAEVMERLRARVAPAEWAALRLGDARNASWVYWATQARASAMETLALAREEGVICRPLLDPERGGPPASRSAPDYPWLELLAPGDTVLLCHDGEPWAWFRLRAVELSTPFPFPVQPVFQLVAASSPLGRRLTRAGYRQWHGRPGRASPPGYSCLAVEPHGAPVVTPRPRGRGIRDTMTAFLPAVGPEL